MMATGRADCAADRHLTAHVAQCNGVGKQCSLQQASAGCNQCTRRRTDGVQLCGEACCLCAQCALAICGDCGVAIMVRFQA